MHPKTTIAKRLKEIMEERGINAAELARLADVKKTFLYDVLSGKSLHPSSITLSKVAKHLGIPLTYLTGTSPLTSASKKEVEKPPFVSIPRISVDAAAGGGSFSDDSEDLEFYYFRRSWVRNRLNARPDDLRLLFIRGDSMSPTLMDGDIVMVNMADKNPTPPGIFVLYDGIGLVAKRLENFAGDTKNIRVTSDNKQYSDYERSASEIKIIGRIVWFAREL